MSSPDRHHEINIQDSDQPRRLQPGSSEHTLSPAGRNRQFRNDAPKHNYSPFMRDVLASSVEALGTFLFLFAAYGAVNAASAASAADGGKDATGGVAGVLMIATSFGLSLLVVAWALYRVSGGLLNPAVTVALVISKAITPRRGAMFVAAQLVGALVAGALVQGLFPGPFKGANTLKNGISIAQGFFLEVILTALFTIVILMLAVEKSKHTYLAPVGIGLALFLVHLVAVPFTGCSVNPARSFGASVFEGTWDDHWVFWLAPVLGGVLASLFHLGLKRLDYESLNPGQDASRESEKKQESREVEHAHGGGAGRV
ncbi:aquaporin-2 [Fimicolochytrium jonesii]|uniref:aquaporin-2 n=1 Tax=Fimicolochytrium jonesii TaxID=1396493 RepID=UPI0022FE192D|nr:aquaporin-2 [Fimicolochytrium jonesii]KAI8820196.1 aquaporin-2 [Fimicolochytrium jonesii]